MLKKMVRHRCLGMARAGCAETWGEGGIGVLAFQPTPVCHTEVCTFDNGISPINGEPPYSLHMGKRTGGRPCYCLKAKARCMRQTCSTCTFTLRDHGIRASLENFTAVSSLYVAP